MIWSLPGVRPVLDSQIKCEWNYLYGGLGSHRRISALLTDHSGQPGLESTVSIRTRAKRLGFAPHFDPRPSRLSSPGWESKFAEQCAYHRSASPQSLAQSVEVTGGFDQRSDRQLNFPNQRIASRSLGASPPALVDQSGIGSVFARSCLDARSSKRFVRKLIVHIYFELGIARPSPHPVCRDSFSTRGRVNQFSAFREGRGMANPDG